MKAVDELIKDWGVDASEWNYSYNTENGELGIYLAKNAFLGLTGEVKITLADGSVVDLKSSDVSFDEKENLILPGYNFDEKTGEWVAAELPAAINGLPGIEVGKDGMYVATLGNGMKITGSEYSAYIGTDGMARLGGAIYNPETKTWELNKVTTLYGENAPKFNQEDINNGNIDEYFKVIYDTEGWAKVMVGRDLPTNLEMKWGPDLQNVDADTDGKKDDRVQVFFMSDTSSAATQVPFVNGGVFVEVVTENGMVGRVTPVFSTRGDEVLIFKNWFGKLELLDEFAFAENQVNFTAEHWRSVMQGGTVLELVKYVSPTIAYSPETNAINAGTDSLPIFQVGSPETEARMGLMENVNTLQSEDLEGDVFFSAVLRPIKK